MALPIHRPTTPGRRGATQSTGTALSKKRPEKSLLRPLPHRGGRNSQGKITVRHRGGGQKHFYRMVDFLQNRYDEPAKVIAIEYDPNRTAHIALIQFADGEKRYILAPIGLAEGSDVLFSRQSAPAKVGNRMPLMAIPSGMAVHNIELVPGRGGVLMRSAGAQAMLMGIEGSVAQLKLSSGEVRLLPKEAMASVGQVGNIEHSNVRLGKAGRMRWRGVRPTVRGKAMNPVDHPHGGGEGNQPIGLRRPKTPWGRAAFGVRTRKKHRRSNALIIQRRG